MGCHKNQFQSRLLVYQELRTEWSITCLQP
jgi:hypothetical protein